MKRVLWITIPFMLSLMVGIFFLGKEVIFHKIDYHIPSEYEIHIGEYNSHYILVEFYNDEGYRCDKYVVSKKQRQRIVKERIVNDYFYSVYPFYTLLYWLLVIAFVVYFIQWWVSVDCCKPAGRYDEWSASCYGLCDKRCDLYNKIKDYDLTPHKEKFNHFWGY